MDQAVIPVQYILYTNFSVDTIFHDGSLLKLSPCGSVFLHVHPPAEGQHPLQSENSIQQRTQFATSTYRDKVRLALDFRNRFVENPFLCQELIDPCDITRCYLDIFLVSWPSSMSECKLRVYPEGSVELFSIDDRCSVCLAAHRLAVTVRYLAKLSSNRVTRSERDNRDAIMLEKPNSEHRIKSTAGGIDKSINENDPQAAKKDSVRVSVTSSEVSKSGPEPSEKKAGAILNSASWDYCWTVQNHSLKSLPSEWIHPVQLLMDFVKTEDYALTLQRAIESGRVEEYQSQKAQESNADVSAVHTALPQTLGTRCPAPHLHKWKQEDLEGEGLYSGKVKAFYLKGTLYRLLEQERCIEIYPEDGSIICSSNCQTFCHFISNNGQIEERMYSTTFPPPHSMDFSYSVSKLISVAARVLQILPNEYSQSSAKEDEICYKYSDSNQKLESSPSTRVLEECLVPGLGRFTALSCGVVRIVFEDRTCLDMQTDFTSQLDMPRTLGHRFQPLSELNGACRLLLPNGHYHLVNVNNPDVLYERYIEAALDWVKWVKTPASERHDLYKDTINDPDRQNKVDAELKKIQCFSYILENSVLPKSNAMLKGQSSFAKLSIASPPLPNTSACDGSNFDPNMINELLKKNADIMKDLDRILKTNGEPVPCKETKMHK